MRDHADFQSRLAGRKRSGTIITHHFRLLALAVGLCATSLTFARQPPPHPVRNDELVSVHSYMTQRIDPAADAVWALTNERMDDAGSLSAERMTQADWMELEARARELYAGAHELSLEPRLKAVVPGERILDSGRYGSPDAHAVQRHLAAEPAAFRQLATRLADHSLAIAEAARAHDVLAVQKRVDALDMVCEGCHIRYWYPEQRPLIKSLGLPVPD